MVMFRPSDPEEWTRLILRRTITNMSFQLTKKRATNDIFKISMSGPPKELVDFCEDFDQLYGEVMKNIQDGGAAGGAAATPDDDDDDVEKLRERIRELELENKKLPKK
ncbi:hypothetical protein C0J50_4877 [Silurus asotus]|uniref:Uncharacterized protein n=1 Tax=Silurus asotus TaxID=30991 RepID=A0AAD5FDB2_SILAS|nr:hypothetical protein C0J50_4877 [Silurus asotus]